MQVASKEYQEHQVFSLLDEYISYYKSWSFNIMMFVTQGTNAFLNIDTYVYSSMAGTLDSLKLVLKTGRINDAYALLRKFHDSAIMNVYVRLYLDDYDNYQNFVVEKIQKWLEGTDQLPNFRGMTNYIKDSKVTSELYKILNTDDRYDKIRDRCNDNTHYNFYRNVMLNDNEIRNENRGKYLNLIRSDITQLLLLHLAFIFHTQEHYMRSSDYTDYLDVGDTPPEDSQYWVATFIQEIFDKVIKSKRPDIAKYIKDHTTMHLE